MFPNHQAAKVLVVAPRTEYDIIWARSLGMHQGRGLDLFTDFPLIDISDARQTRYPDNTFDAVVLGWAQPYIDSKQVLTEMTRITRPSGIIGVGWEYVSNISKHRNEHAKSHLKTHPDLENLVAEVTRNIFCTFDAGTAEHDHHETIFVMPTKS